MQRITSIIIFLCILGGGTAAAGLHLTRMPDLRLLDAQFRLLRARAPRPAKFEVVVVGIDEDTVKALPEPITLWHRHLGRFFQIMAAARPSVIGVDIILPDRSYDQVAPGSDGALLRGILTARRACPLVLALTVDPSGRPRPVHKPFVVAAGPGGTGFALFRVDPDGAVRQFDERLTESGEPVPTLAGQMARRLGVEPRYGYLDYSRGAAFRYVPFHQVLEWADSGQEARIERMFGGKAVLLGTVFPFSDGQRIAVKLAAWDRDARDTPGVLLHAQALRNVIDGDLIQPVSPAVVTGLAGGAALLWFASGGTVTVTAVLGAILAALFAASTWLLTKGLFLPIGATALTAVVAHGGRHLYETALKLRERRRLRGVFSGYVSPAVMREILAGNLHPDLGGVSRYVCVLFSDIRGYTTRSEGMSPHAIVDFLNRYFEQVVALIHARGGTVVSFMGDGIMAVFGAPNSLDNPCMSAFEAAREMLRHVSEFNSRFRKAGEAPVEIGVGLHAGEAIVGHVGSSSRHDYTAIGDVTNVSSRLEGLTKEAGYRLVCSKTVAGNLPEAARLTSLGPMAIKGHTPVEVYGYDKI